MKIKFYSLLVFVSLLLASCQPKVELPRFIEAGILGGVRLEEGILFAVTEKRTKEEIDNLVKMAAL